LESQTLFLNSPKTSSTSNLRQQLE